MALLGQKKHEAPHEEGEAWLISYADMMTLLFGLFVILYSISKVDDVKLAEVGKEVAESFGGKFVETHGSDVGKVSEERQLRAFHMLVAMLNLGESPADAVRKLEAEAKKSKIDGAALEELKNKLAKAQKLEGTFGTGADKDHLIDIALAGDLLFKPGTDQLRPDAAQRIAEIAGELNRMRGFVGVEVVGHSDGSPTGKGAIDNWALSSMRAAAVARALMKYGVDKKVVKVSGMGDLVPLFPERTSDGRPLPENMARNRRVHIIVKKAPTDEGE